MTKNSPARATAPHISLIVHITRDELRRYLDVTEYANGFGNRFLWVCAKRSRLLPDGGGSPDLQEHISRLRHVIEHAKNVGEMQRDPQAAAYWRAIYGRLSAERAGLLGAITARADPTLLDALVEIERDRGTLSLKYLITGHVLGRPYDRGANPFQDFSTLIKLRNDVMHAKQQDEFVVSRLEDGADGVTRETIHSPKHVKAFHQRALLWGDAAPGYSCRRSDALQSPALAEWACQVSEAMVDSVIAMFPKDVPLRGPDPLGLVRTAWRGCPGSRMEGIRRARAQLQSEQSG